VQGLRGEEQGRGNVFRGQTRVAAPKVLRGKACGELLEDEFHRNTGPPDHRLAHHDLLVDFDPSQEVAHDPNSKVGRTLAQEPTRPIQPVPKGSEHRPMRLTSRGA